MRLILWLIVMNKFNSQVLYLLCSVQSALEADDISPEAVVDEYVLQTGLINEIKTWLCHLSSQQVLPYNPYIVLVGKANKIAER